MVDSLIAVTIVAGGPGYLIAFIMVLGLRTWLSQRSKSLTSARWIGIVLNSLLLFLAVLLIVYALTLINTILPPNQLRRDWTRSILAIILALLPYFIVFPLGGWWLGMRGTPPVNEPLPLTPQIVPGKEE